MFLFGYRDIHGKRVKHTPKNSWFYDPFVIFKKKYKPTDILISTNDMHQDILEDAIQFIFDHPVKAIGQEDPSKVEEVLSVYLEEHVTLTGIEEACQEWANGQFWNLYYRKE